MMTGQCGTYQWMAPEVIGGHIYTEKADVSALKNSAEVISLNKRF